MGKRESKIFQVVDIAIISCTIYGEPFGDDEKKERMVVAVITEEEEERE